MHALTNGYNGRGKKGSFLFLLKLRLSNLALRDLFLLSPRHRHFHEEQQTVWLLNCLFDKLGTRLSSPPALNAYHSERSRRTRPVQFSVHKKCSQNQRRPAKDRCCVQANLTRGQSATRDTLLNETRQLSKALGKATPNTESDSR